jgi:hypothetical protein
MASRQKQALKANRKVILAQERAWATSTALGLRKQKVFTVWEVLMPVLLIFNFARAKVGRENFVLNQIFTKNLALDAAFKMAREDMSKDLAMAWPRKRTGELLTSVEGGIYSEVVRNRQLEEMELLIDHYLPLLKAPGRDFPALVRSCYHGREAFDSYLETLKQAEAKVTQASLETLGDKGDPVYVKRIEGILEHYRQRTAEKIFGPRSDA